ncbi:MAG: DegV family protein [Anaerolineales bacterium]|nr:DegV family protein [Anaerolineales bacterium]
MTKARVALVTDSTAYIPKAVCEQLGIHIVPNVVNWSGKSYRDGVDIGAVEFFERLKVDPVAPTTSVASLGEMKEVYAAAASAAEAVIGVHLSAKLSNTFKVAQEAAALLPDKPIRVFDAETTAMAMGYIVVLAARAAAAGQSAEQVGQLITTAVPRTGVVLTVETLKYLQRGGRIGAAAAFAAGVLDLKPLLEVRDGMIHPLERVRSRKKAMARLVEIVCERLAGKSQIRLATLHAAAEAEATEILAAAQARLGGAVVETVVTDVSPTVATHTGPGTIGLAYLEGV